MNIHFEFRFRRTHTLPEFGRVFGSVQAKTDSAGKEFLKQFLKFFKNHLDGPDWGEQFGVYPEGTGWRFTISMTSQGLSKYDAAKGYDESCSAFLNS